MLIGFSPLEVGAGSRTAEAGEPAIPGPAGTLPGSLKPRPARDDNDTDTSHVRWPTSALSRD